MKEWELARASWRLVKRSRVGSATTTQTLDLRSEDCVCLVWRPGESHSADHGRVDGEAEHSSYLAEDVTGMSRIRLKGIASTLLPDPPYRHRLTSI